MAMTGGTAYLVKSEYANYGSANWTTDLYIYVKVISQNVISNTSTITLGMYVYSRYEIAWSDFGTNGTSYIGTATSGANCFTFTAGQSGSGTKWLIENKQVTVTHNSNGTLTLPIYWHWGVNSSWGQYTGPSGSYNVTLPSLDRSAPTVSCSVSNITANGFKISASSSATSDIWQYSLNGGTSWTQFSTTAGTSASVTLSSLSPNTTYSVRVRARKRTNQVYGTSSTVSAKTLGGAVILSCGSFRRTPRPSAFLCGLPCIIPPTPITSPSKTVLQLICPWRACLVIWYGLPLYYADRFGTYNPTERHGQRQILHGDHRAGHQERKHTDWKRIYLYLHRQYIRIEFRSDPFRFHLRGQLFYHHRHHRE